MALKLLVRVGGWSDKTKVILNSTQFKFKFQLKLELLFSILFLLAGWLDGRVEVIIMLSQLSTKLKLKLKLSLAIWCAQDVKNVGFLRRNKFFLPSSASTSTST